MKIPPVHIPEDPQITIDAQEGMIDSLRAERDSLKEQLSTARVTKYMAECESLEKERDEWERLAHEWMAAHDVLKEKYEPMVLISASLDSASNTSACGISHKDLCNGSAESLLDIPSSNKNSGVGGSGE